MTTEQYREQMVTSRHNHNNNNTLPDTNSCAVLDLSEVKLVERVMKFTEGEGKENGQTADRFDMQYIYRRGWDKYI